MYIPSPINLRQKWDIAKTQESGKFLIINEAGEEHAYLQLKSSVGAPISILNVKTSGMYVSGDERDVFLYSQPKATLKRFPN